MGRLRERFPGLAVAVLCAAALAMVSFAHRPVGAASASDPALVAYIALGGTLDELCGLDDGDEAAAYHCPACTLAKTLSTAPAQASVEVAVSWSTAEALPVPILLPRGHGPRAPPARSPPAFQLI
jgi:hypothetical protein